MAVNKLTFLGGTRENFQNGRETLRIGASREDSYSSPCPASLRRHAPWGVCRTFQFNQEIRVIRLVPFYPDACVIQALYFLQIPITYPTTAPEIAVPELDGKTAKMYR